MITIVKRNLLSMHGRALVFFTIMLLVFAWVTAHYVHSINRASTFATPVGIDDKEADDVQFKKWAELAGNPVKTIYLSENSNIDNSFLVTIRNKYPNVQELNIAYVPITDEGLKHLLRLPELRRLSLSGLNNKLGGTGISDQGLANLKDLAKIEKFSITYASITDGGLTNLRNWKELRELNIACTPLTNECLAIVSDFSQLERLGLVQTAITERGLVHLGKMKNLKYLNFPDVPTDDSLQFIGELLNLEELLLGKSNLTDEGLVHLNCLRRLRKIGLWKTAVTGHGIRHLPSSIEDLDLSESRVSDAAAKDFARLSKLRRLILSESKITDAGVSYLVKLDHLESLDLDGCKGVTDSSISYIAKLKNLKKLVISGTNVTDKCLSQISQMPQLSELEVRSQIVTKESLLILRKRLPNLTIISSYVLKSP